MSKATINKEIEQTLAIEEQLNALKEQLANAQKDIPQDSFKKVGVSTKGDKVVVYFSKRKFPVTLAPKQVEEIARMHKVILRFAKDNCGGAE